MSAARRDEILVTGGAGFVGTNLAATLARRGRRVVILDDLSRKGVDANLRWLERTHGEAIRTLVGDIRDRDLVEDAVAHASAVFHLAAQVAVTTSLDDPLADFGVNAQGTLGLLEALRRLDDPPPLVFTSTNKVYGALEEVPLVERETRYEPVDDAVLRRGVPETWPLSFHSPYGCSKGTADQYVLDYARTFDLPAVVFRMSCIYGPHQHGTEDQGWLAHFLIRAIEGAPITIWGDGKQVRDVLFVDDLVSALLRVVERIDSVAGRVFNVGGGAANTTSLLELLELIRAVHGERPKVAWRPWRLADQRYYVSDTRALEAAVGWSPEVSVASGVTRLYEWLLRSRATPLSRWSVVEEKSHAEDDARRRAGRARPDAA